MKENKNDKLVVKHNKLIEFKGRMSANELKLFSLIIANVREQQEETLEKYLIDITALKEQTEHKDFYNYLKEVAFRLEEKSIEVEKMNERGKRTSFKMRLIYRPKIAEDTDYLEMYIDKELIPYITDLKKEFTRYQIENILMLKSSYSIRIYELLKQYQKIGKREIKLEELRQYLGIEKHEYERFYNFDTRVLKVAERELNREVDNEGNIIEEGTDIRFSYEKIKKGRRIVSILFTIESLHDTAVYLSNIKELKEKMGIKEENWSNKQVMDIYELAVKKTQDTVDVYKYVNLNYLHVKDKARNPYGYLIDAIKNDYAKAVPQLKLNYILK